MKTKRWQKSVLATAADVKIALPWEKPALRAAFQARRQAKADQGRKSNA